MTKVMVAYATKMGATREIAEAIGITLRGAGMEATVSDASEVATLAGYDAAVVGSAVYMAHWRPEAVEVLERQAEHGTKMPIWLYQSGPLDHTQMPAPAKVQRLAIAIGAAPPVTFGGRVEPGTAKGFIAKKMAKGPKAGDYRDFDQIAQWATGITTELASRQTGR